MSFLEFKEGPIVRMSEIVSVEPDTDHGRVTVRMRCAASIIVSTDDVAATMADVKRAILVAENTR